MNNHLSKYEVARIVEAAKSLVEAHQRRSNTSNYATLGEEGAMWELDFRLGSFRQAKGYKNA